MLARDEYAARARAHAAGCAAERRRSATFSRLRLATFLAGVAALTWWLGFEGGLAAAAVTIAVWILFGVLVVVHARIEARADWCDAMRVVSPRHTAEAVDNAMIRTMFEQFRIECPKLLAARLDSADDSGVIRP